jgi:hypothetical protein
MMTRVSEEVGFALPFNQAAGRFLLLRTVNERENLTSARGFTKCEPANHIGLSTTYLSIGFARCTKVET